MTTWVKVAAVLVVQLALVALGVAPQLSARATGDEYLFRVELFDPIDPSRGAYVDLAYPDLGLDAQQEGDGFDSDIGTVYLPLSEQDGVWVADDTVTERPADGPYLACDSHGWRLRCGIESWFLPQDEAAAFEDLVRDGAAAAEVRIDSRGNAALVDVRQR